LETVRILRSRVFWCALAIAIALLLISPLSLRFVSSALEDSEPPRRADAALVLAGDGYGDRMRTAAELARRGLVPKVYVSGPEGFYGLHEDDLAIAWAVKQGYPASFFVPLPIKATSTREEAEAVVPRLRKDEIRNLMIVTSDYHSGRAGRVFRKVAPDINITIVGAPDTLFELRNWWRTREGQKAVFYEWSKVIADRVGL
jgi:uncharacterized SAM-binding protein YcdF (DUF218 family)